SCIIMPLQVGERTAGVINVTNPISRRPFMERDVQLLTAAASFVGGALSSAELYHEATGLHRDLEEILDSMRVGTIALTTDEYVMHLNERARRLLSVTEIVPGQTRLRQITPPALHQCCRRLMQDVQAGG